MNISYVKNRYDKATILQQFIFKGIVLFLFWEIAYGIFIGPHQVVDHSLVDAVTYMSSFLLNVIFDSSVVEGNVVTLNGIKAVFVGIGCNGLQIEMLFLGFIIAAPGSLKHKIYFGLMGLILIYFTNVFRVMILAYNFIQSPTTFDFNHKYTYAYAVYGVIFCLWMLWINKFSGLKNKQ